MEQYLKVPPGILEQTVKYLKMLQQPMWSDETMAELENIQNFTLALEALVEFHRIVNK